VPLNRLMPGIAETVVRHTSTYRVPDYIAGHVVLESYGLELKRIATFGCSCRIPFPDQFIRALCLSMALTKRKGMVPNVLRRGDRVRRCKPCGPYQRYN
jgi:hypothetical protein